MSDSSKELARVPEGQSSIPTAIPLTATTSIDLSWLPESKRVELLMEYTKGVLDISKKATELHVDTAALESTLRKLSDTTQEVAGAGNAVTLTHTQTTSIGRTEVIMGNTTQAQTGRLTKSQTGEEDWTRYYIFAALIALVLIAALIR